MYTFQTGVLIVIRIFSEDKLFVKLYIKRYVYFDFLLAFLLLVLSLTLFFMLCAVSNSWIFIHTIYMMQHTLDFEFFKDEQTK